MTDAIEQRGPSAQGRLQPPFVCPWNSDGCTHVTRTTAVAHRRHTSRATKNRKCASEFTAPRPRKSMPPVPRNSSLVWTQPVLRAKQSAPHQHSPNKHDFFLSCVSSARGVRFRSSTFNS